MMDTTPPPSLADFPIKQRGGGRDRLDLVVIETPFAGDIERNLKYLRACMRDSLLRGEAPIASHAMYTQPGVLDDADPGDRRLGIDAGFAWRAMAGRTVLYTDLGMSRGMIEGLRHALTLTGDDHDIEMRELGEGWEARADEVSATFKTRWPR